MGSFFLDPEDVKEYKSGISVKEQGSLDLTSDHEAQGAHLKGPKGLKLNLI